MHVKVNICWSPSGAGTRGREAGDTFVTQPRQVLSSENCGCLTRYLTIYISNYLLPYSAEPGGQHGGAGAGGAAPLGLVAGGDRAGALRLLPSHLPQAHLARDS